LTCPPALRGQQKPVERKRKVIGKSLQRLDAQENCQPGKKTQWAWEDPSRLCTFTAKEGCF
jgi:hypothetical protein